MSATSSKSSLLDEFYALGVPNFLFIQCVCLIEGNLEQRATEASQYNIAVHLLSELWMTWPQLFNSALGGTTT